MQYFILFCLFLLTVYILYSNKSTQKKIQVLLHAHSALFWALKNKKVIDMTDWKEGNKVARGEKMGDMGLKDFVDLYKDE